MVSVTQCAAQNAFMRTHTPRSHAHLSTLDPAGATLAVLDLMEDACPVLLEGGEESSGLPPTPPSPRCRSATSATPPGSPRFKPRNASARRPSIWGSSDEEDGDGQENEREEEEEGGCVVHLLSKTHLHWILILLIFRLFLCKHTHTTGGMTGMKTKMRGL